MSEPAYEPAQIPAGEEPSGHPLDPLDDSFGENLSSHLEQEREATLTAVQDMLAELPTSGGAEPSMTPAARDLAVTSWLDVQGVDPELHGDVKELAQQIYALNAGTYGPTQELVTAAYTAAAERVKENVQVAEQVTDIMDGLESVFGSLDREQVWAKVQELTPADLMERPDAERIAALAFYDAAADVAGKPVSSMFDVADRHAHAAKITQQMQPKAAVNYDPESVAHVAADLGVSPEWALEHAHDLGVRTLTSQRS